VLKLFCVLLTLAILSGASFIFGYLYGDFDVILTTVGWVWDSAPVIRASLLSVVIFIINMALAFFTCRGSYQSFRAEFFAFTVIVLSLSLLFFWPSALEDSGLQAHFHYGGLFPVVVFHLIASGLLASDFWWYGGRNIDDDQFGYISRGDVDLLTEFRVSILDDASYVIECVASEVTGEAKSELNKLVLLVQAGNVPEKEFLLENLKEAATHLAASQNRYAAISLERVTRFLRRGLRGEADA